MLYFRFQIRHESVPAQLMKIQLLSILTDCFQFGSNLEETIEQTASAQRDLSVMLSYN